MIAAALSALPLLSQMGQGLISSVGQDVAGLFDSASSALTGQNVQGSANSGAGATTPATVSSTGQALSSSMLNAFTAAQADLKSITQSGVSKSDFESAAQALASATGQNSAGATQTADQIFSAADSSGSATVTPSQLSSYLGHAANQKYQAADGLLNGLIGQMSGLLGGPTSVTA